MPVCLDLSIFSVYGHGAGFEQVLNTSYLCLLAKYTAKNVHTCLGPHMFYTFFMCLNKFNIYLYYINNTGVKHMYCALFYVLYQCALFYVKHKHMFTFFLCDGRFFRDREN